MQQIVTLPEGGTVSWPAVRDLLVARGFAVQLRMIDGELAFPHEEPPENWRELRIGTTAGSLVTVKREQDQLVLVVWGNADAGLVETWNALTWAFAHVSDALIETPAGPQSSGQYWNRADLPAALRGNPASG
jgi:hypothetical protein